MHPRHVEIFNAIKSNDNATLSALVKEIPHAAWIVDETGVGALQFALETAKSSAIAEDRAINKTLIDIFLKQTLENTIDAKVSQSHFEQAKMGMNYALLLTIRTFLKLPQFAGQAKIADFFSNITNEFPYLQQSNQSSVNYFGNKLMGKLGAASRENQRETMGNDIKAALVEQIQSYLRSLAVCAAFIQFFQKKSFNNTTELLQALKAEIDKWKGQPIFSTHIRSAMGYTGTSTSTVISLQKLEAAADFLLTKNGELPNPLTPEQAQNLILLCTKAHPFSKEELRGYWSGLANEILRQKEKEPNHLVELYKIIIDKQWLRTEEGVPYTLAVTEHSLLGSIDQEQIINLLRTEQKNHFIPPLENSSDLILQCPTAEMSLTDEILALYPLPPNQKIFIASARNIKQDLQYTYLLLMNNAQLSVSFPSDDLKENPLEHFPQAPKPIAFEITAPSQVLHLASKVANSCTTRNGLTIKITNLILKQSTATWIYTIQQALGPNQQINLHIYQDLSHAGHTPIRADAIITQSSIHSGPIVQGKDKNKIRATYPKDFYELYQKLDWIEGQHLENEEAQLACIQQALVKNKPLYFIFDQQKSETSLIDKVQALLKEKKSQKTCVIRFDIASQKQSSITILDCSVTADKVTEGPLTAAKLCITLPKEVARPTATPSPAPSNASSSSSSTSTALILRPSVSTVNPASPVNTGLNNEVLVGQTVVPVDMKEGDDYSGTVLNFN